MGHPAPGRRRREIVAVIQFKFDESYDQQIMCVGGWIADEHEWKRLETRWQKRIDQENAHSRPDQQITEFHATEMNCKDGEFANWDHPKCIAFSKRLITLLAERKMGAIAIACDMDAIREVFPKGDAEGMIRRTYVLTFKQMMVDVAHVMQDYFPGDKLLLIHDHGSWDDLLLKGYNLMIDEPGWAPRSLFEGLLAKTGRTAVGLQAADMIAYEVFKGVRAKTSNPEAGMRGAMQGMINQEIPIIARWINLPAAKALYGVMRESGRYPDLDERGVS
jgi:hypothetical protein